MSLNHRMAAQWASNRKINLNSPSPLPALVDAVENGVKTPLGSATAATSEVTGLESNSSNPPSNSLTSGTATPSRKRKTQDPPGDDVPQKKPKSIASSSNAKPQSKTSTAKSYPPPSTRLADLGGLGGTVEKLLELVAMPLRHPEIYAHTGVQPPRGVLLHGPPGCGKTMLAHAIAGELQVPFISVSAPSIVSGMSGESEKTLRDTFEEAKKHAPCILFIDEIDAITPKRESAQREMERRIVAQFLTCMDDLSWDKTEGKAVVLIGATNRPDSLDAALRRAGRFDHEICMNVPDDIGRAQILRVLCSKLRLSGDFDFESLATQTPGYVGADLSALTGAAGIIAVKRIFQEIADGKIVLPASITELDLQEVSNPLVGTETLETDVMILDEPAPAVSEMIDPVGAIKDTSSALTSLSATSSIARFLQTYPDPLTPAQLSPLHITYADFLTALPSIQPSSTREGFASVPRVSWDDVGALAAIRDELHMAIVQPIRHPALFAAVGISAPAGVLLWGPPGCGKTLLAKAVASESRANFISVKGPELLNKYVGESERALRQVFSRARASAPCVVFFDELDALVPRRDDSLSESSARVVNTLLTELDGLDARNGVHIVAATNRPDMLDPAMCRPGRLDKLLFVDLPDARERKEIFGTLVRRLPLGDPNDPGSDRETIKIFVGHERFDGFSGADIAALVREAGVVALRREIATWEGAGSAMTGTTDQNPWGLQSQAVESKQTPTVIVSLRDFEFAANKVGPSVSAAQRRKYQNLRARFSGASPTVMVKLPEEIEKET